ncbi:MAG: hypothetical protein A2031_07525 [Deltaproteobacteria bacterium RBG_19FT_COMBO_43_11]|nr:MAG: hypothetical protein A2031_07525 [Deltaproteobacteria bacterium RBG_19FT_COMBO_43_11]
MEIDKCIFTLINSGWSNSFFDSIMPCLSHLADASIVWLWVVLIGMLSGWRLTHAARADLNNRQKRTLIVKAGLFFCLYIALIYSVNAGVYNSLKHLSNRSRPYVHQTVILRVSPTIVSNLKSNGSFPSGHASNAFMLAALLAELFRRKRAVFYGLAAMIALSRVYLGVHYPSDVLIGGCLGLVIAWVMLYIRSTLNRITHDSFFPS